MNRNRRLALMGIPFLIFACRSSEPAAPSSTSNGTPDESSPATPEAAPATTPGSIPAAEGSKVDLTDPAAAAACAEIATRSPGAFTSDAAFEVTGASTVAAAFDDVERLALAFDWPAKRVQDGSTVWRYDARLSMALELLDPSADRSFPVSTTPYAVRVWKYEKHERACTTVAMGHQESFGGEPMEGTATVLVTKRSDAEIEGAIALKDAKGVESKLSFHAPFAATLESDTTICCLASLGGG